MDKLRLYSLQLRLYHGCVIMGLMRVGCNIIFSRVIFDHLRRCGVENRLSVNFWVSEDRLEVKLNATLDFEFFTLVCL